MRIKSFVLLTITALANVILNALFIPRFGMIGAAAASLFSYVLCGGMFVGTFLHITKMPIRELLILKRSDIQAIRSKLSK